MKPLSLDSTDKELLYETVVEVRNLIKRTDQHSADRKNENLAIHDKLEQIQKSREEDRLFIYNLKNDIEKKMLQEKHRVELRMAMIIGSLGVAAGGVGSFGFKMLENFF